MLNKENCVEILKDKLYWISDTNPPKNLKNSYFFCIDKVFPFKKGFNLRAIFFRFRAFKPGPDAPFHPRNGPTDNRPTKLQCQNIPLHFD